jgi:DNA-binding FadR family transcriptional regulator
MKYARAELADVLRGRILRGLQGGVLRLGDRLPSARELEAELGTDHRVILDAYRVLAA